MLLYDLVLLLVIVAWLLEVLRDLDTYAQIDLPPLSSESQLLAG